MLNFWRLEFYFGGERQSVSVTGSVALPLRLVCVCVGVFLGVVADASSGCCCPCAVLLSVRPRGRQTEQQHSSSAPCQSICIVACCSHCCVRQSLALSGITQLDAGHRQGHSRWLDRTKTADLTATIAGQETRFMCVCVCVCWQQTESKVQRPRSLIYQTNKDFFFFSLNSE